MQVKCSLDRVTIVLSFDDGDELYLPQRLRELGLEGRDPGRDDMFRAWYYKRYDGDVTRTVFALFKNPFQDSWRLDTSYHLEDERDRQMLGNLVACFEHAHFSRLDVAFDFINSDQPNMAHRVYRWGTGEKVIRAEDATMEYRGQNKNIETLYWGSRKSQQQVRYYDKLKEQKKAHKKVPADVKQWERLELQLRGQKVSEWFDSACAMLNQFKMPRIALLKPKERAMLNALEQGVVKWPELTPNTRTKYHRLLADHDGLDEEYAHAAYDALFDNVGRIQNELSTLLSWAGINVENDD